MLYLETQCCNYWDSTCRKLEITKINLFLRRVPKNWRCRIFRSNTVLTNFNCQIKTTSVWGKQGVLECFEVDSRLCHTSCTLSGFRPTTTLSPRQAPGTPKSENLMPSPGQQNYQAQRYITAVNTRTQDLGNEVERKLTLALHAQSSRVCRSVHVSFVTSSPRGERFQTSSLGKMAATN